MSQILICDDERDIVSALKIYLSAEGYECLEAYDGEQALKILKTEKVQAVLLDVMMPKMDGLTALDLIRKESNVPVILLTAKSENSDKVLGLNVGADDYVTKPFDPVEVMARVRAQVRRNTKLGSSPLCDADNILTVGDCKTREVRAYGDPVSLTATEYDILHLLLSHPGQVFKSREIYRLIRDESPVGSENTIAVHIRHLREKIEINPAEPKYLKVFGDTATKSTQRRKTMKSNYLLKSLAFVLAAVMLICTVASAAGLVVCLAFGAYSEGKDALTHNQNNRILSDYAYNVEAYLFDDPEKLKEVFEGTGIQAKITNPDGSLHLTAGEEAASATEHHITFKCVYLDNYQYTINTGSPRNYYLDLNGDLRPLTEFSKIYHITPEKMANLIAEGGHVITPSSDLPINPDPIPYFDEDTQPPVMAETETSEIPVIEVPGNDFEDFYLCPLEDNYVILQNGAFSPVYISNKPETNYYTGSYIYSRDGRFGYIGNVFPDEIEDKAYTVKLTMTEAYHVQNTDDYEYMILDFVGDNMYQFVWLTPLFLVISVLLLIYLASASGHTKNGVRETWIEKIPTDLYLALCTLICFVPIYVDVERLILTAGDIYSVGAVIGVMAAGYAALFVGIVMSLALRIKTKRIFSYTLVFMALKLLLKCVRLLFHAVAYICSNIGTLWTNVLCAVIFFFWTIALATACSHYSDGPAILLLLFGLTVFPAVFIYVGYQQNKINRVCKKIGDGQVDSKVDTKYMTPNHRSQAETVNRIGSGLSAALTERIKSERLKTELITNVSHDLKTPLTSIVSYADLLSREQGSENPDGEKMKEYTNVISRQSARLKKLTEDLVEASKASTGNVEVNAEVLDVSELLSQSVGEFADRFEAAGLTPVETGPNAPVQIFADGRHVWRIFENLLVNTCKYSLAGTRVYIDIAEKAADVTVTIKNISSRPLNITPEELTERFVRGDSSRHTEGSGLGLSIAKSLAELQGGTLELDIDGDCFKAILTFKKA